MLEITDAGVRRYGSFFEYELENGELLHISEWNGECFTVKKNGEEIRYFPVYEEIDLDEWEIIGFEER